MIGQKILMENFNGFQDRDKKSRPTFMRIETKLIHIDSVRPNEVYRSRHSEINRTHFVDDSGDILKSNNSYTSNQTYQTKPEINRMVIA